MEEIGSMIGISFNMQVILVLSLYPQNCRLSVGHYLSTKNFLLQIFKTLAIFFKLREKHIIHAKTGSLRKSKLSLLDVQ